MSGTQQLPRIFPPRWRLPLLFAFSHLVLGLLVLEPAPFTGGDNGAYVALAESLVQRGDYSEMWDPALAPHTQYPPLFPAVLALLMLVGIRGWIAFKIVGVIFSAVAVGFSVVWLERMSTRWIAIAGGALLAVSPGILDLTHAVLSDVPFWTLSIIALYGIALMQPEEPTARAPVRVIALAAGAAVLALLTRSAGVPLIAATMLWLGFSRRWRELSWFTAFVFPLAFAWWLRGTLLGGDGYSGWVLRADPYRPDRGVMALADFGPRIMTNLKSYAFEHIPVLFFGWSRFGRAAGAFLFGLALVGWAIRLVRPRVTEIWFAGYGALLLVWPEAWSGVRMVLPIAPVMLLYAFSAVRTLPGALTRRRSVQLVAVTALAIVVLPGLVREVKQGQRCQEEYRNGNRFPCLSRVWLDYFSLTEDLRGKLPPGSVIISRKPTLTYVQSGYRSRMYPLSAEPDSFFAAARRAGTHWAILDAIPDLAPLYLYPIVKAKRERFCMVPDYARQLGVLLRIEEYAVAVPDPAPNAYRTCPLDGSPGDIALWDPPVAN